MESQGIFQIRPKVCLKKEKTPKTRFIKFRNTLQAQMRAGRKNAKGKNAVRLLAVRV